MTNENIKEAIEILDKFNESIFTNTAEVVKAVETAQEVLRRYLAASEDLPEKKEILPGEDEIDCFTANDMNRACNETIESCTLIMTKKLSMYNNMIADECERDEYIRNAVKNILSEEEIHGDSFDVPTIESIVDCLIDKIEKGYWKKIGKEEIVNILLNPSESREMSVNFGVINEYKARYLAETLIKKLEESKNENKRYH